MILGLVLLIPATLRAQNSAYGVLGIGFPTAPYGVVSRSMGGGLTAVDPFSFLNPAAVGRAPALSVEGAAMLEFRNYSVGTINAGGLKQNRFPFLSVTSPLGPKMGYGLGFSEYAERSYDIATSDTLLLRGSSVPVADRSGSAGAIVDMRAAFAWNPSNRWTFGLAGHVLGGSAKVTSSRAFSDSIYRPFTEVVDASFRGFGFSTGFLAIPSSKLRFGGSARIDTYLQRRVIGIALQSVQMPATIGGGVELRPSPLVRFAGTATWRSWSGAQRDLLPSGTHAFNTWDAGVGLDIGGAPGVRGASPFPLRLGFRLGTLAFSPTTEQPKEYAISAGTGFAVSGGRGRFDTAVERVARSGAGVSEHSWQITIGFQIRP
jgi:hypothetical protein